MGRAFINSFPKAQWESEGHRQGDLSGGCKEASSLGARMSGGKGEKSPTSTISEKAEKKTKVWDLFFFTKTAKAVEATVFIGKMSLEGARKHMWDWEHLLHKTAWKTTEQQHGKIKMLQCMQENLQAAVGQSRLVLGPMCSSSGTASSGKDPEHVIPQEDGRGGQQQAARPTSGKQPSVLDRQVITNVL